MPWITSNFSVVAFKMADRQPYLIFKNNKCHILTSETIYPVKTGKVHFDLTLLKKVFKVISKFSNSQCH